MSGSPPRETPTANLLLVDDQEKNLVSLQATLESLGQNMVMARSGEEALRKLLQMDFAVILLDVQMPGLDGFETAKLIKQRERSRHIPIIFLTAINTEESHLFQGYGVGAVDYLSKPFLPELLRSKVAALLDLHRRNERLRQEAEAERARSEAEVVQVRARSEVRLRGLADAMPQIVFWADGLGSLVYANQRWFECAGRPNDASPLDFSDVVVVEDLKRFREGWQEAVRQHRPWEAEFRFGGPQQRPRWHLVRALPLDPRSHDEGGWVGTSTDIDDRHRLEELQRFLASASAALSDTADLPTALRQLCDRAVEEFVEFAAIELQDASGPLKRVAAARRDGLDAGQQDGLRIPDPRTPGSPPAEGSAPISSPASTHLEVLSPVDESTMSALLHGPPAVDGRPLRALATLPVTVQGEVLGSILLASAYPEVFQSDAQRSLLGLSDRVASAVDRARLSALLARRTEALEQADQAKDQFLAILSHELRTPLHSVLGWTQLLRQQDPDQKTLTKGLETIERNARVQAQLIGDLLDISRIVSGKLHIDKMRVDLKRVVTSAAETVQQLADQQGVRLLMHTSDEPAFLEGDAARLQQVVWNLLANAIKFTPRNGEVRCDVQVQSPGDRAKIEVRDTGEGIEPDFLPYVFDRFRQQEGSSSRTHGGLGLGLAIVRHLVEMHGGSVAAFSEGRGKGASFVVELPLSGPPSHAPVSSSRPPPSEASLQGLRVLVVEDDDDARDFLCTMLDHLGASVTGVGLMEHALDALRSHPWDLVLSDIGLPDGDGLALVRQLRTMREGANLPAVAITAFASTQDRRRAIESGFDAHLPKPLDPAALLRTVVAVRNARDRSSVPVPD